ncbi:MAG TPA: Holliday junction branch migration DNA helicase RuvB, partial [Afifellaceae bacterium]|nr:Holliday junction branch migration DNA helicase RuvB [Afifellaceae bacterium]
PRGRLLTPKAFDHLGLAAPASPILQQGLFTDDESS